MTAGAAIGFAPVPVCTTVDMLILLLFVFSMAHTRTLNEGHTQVQKQQRGVSSFPQSESVFALPPQGILILKYSKITLLKCSLVNFLFDQTCCTPPQLFLAEPGEKSAFIIQPSLANYEHNKHPARLCASAVHFLPLLLQVANSYKKWMKCGANGAQTLFTQQGET